MSSLFVRLRNCLLLSFLDLFERSPLVRSILKMVTPEPSTEGYAEEWLAFEEKLGARPLVTNIPAVDIPMLNNMALKYAAQWPRVEGLDILMSSPMHEDLLDKGMHVDRRFYRPEEREGDLPIMVYFHGGGYRSGNLDTEDPVCRYYAKNVPCYVISVDYPLTHDEQGNETGVTIDEIIRAGVAAVEQARSHADHMGAEPNQLLVAGASAGAALATQVAYHFLKHHGKHDRDTIAGLVLFYPITVPTDYATSKEAYSDLHTSYQDNSTGVPIFTTYTIEDMHASTKADTKNPEHFPCLGNLSAFPPAYIVTAGKDPVRDDGTVLNAILKDNNIKTRLDYYQGYPHFFHSVPELEMAHTCMRKAVEGVKWLLNHNDDMPALVGD